MSDIGLVICGIGSEMLKFDENKTVLEMVIPKGHHLYIK